MEKMKAADLMVPIDAFETIPHTATFYEALTALENARDKHLKGENREKILLVSDENGKITGKISPIDLIRGLEPNYDTMDDKDISSRYGFGYATEAMQETYRLWQTPFKDLCRKAVDVQVKAVIPDSQKKQAIHIDDRLDKAFHLFVMGRHDSLFVMKGDEIVGLLIFSDVYERVSETMKECGIGS